MTIKCHIKLLSLVNILFNILFFSLKIKFKSEDVCLSPFTVLCILDHVSKSTQLAVSSGEIVGVGIKEFTDAGKDTLAELLWK